MNIKKNMKKWLLLVVILSAIGIETVSAARLHSCQTQASSGSAPIMVNTIGIEQMEDQTSLPVAEAASSREVVASNNELGVIIAGEPDDQGTYKNLTIRTSTFQCSLPGVQVQNKMMAPWIAEADLDGDGQQEIIVNLTYGYGTGMELNTIQVFRPNGEIIPVENLSSGLERQFGAVVDDEMLKLKLNKKTTLIPFNKLAEPPVASENSTMPVTGGAVQQYKIEDGKLTANYSLQVGMQDYIGELDVQYRYDNGVLKLGPAVLDIDENYLP